MELGAQVEGLTLDKKLDTLSGTRRGKTEYLGRVTGAHGIFVQITKCFSW